MATAQVLLKFAGIHAAAHFNVFHAFLANPWFWGALLAAAIGMVCWLMALKKMPLAIAYPGTALIYVIAPLASAALFGDPLTVQYILGMASIIAGVCLIGFGTAR